MWTASWKWANDQTLAELKNRVPEYAVPKHAHDEYERELQLWLDSGWLLPYPEDELGQSKCLIPLMVIMQKNKQKVCSVPNYRELNDFVDVYTANSELYAQNLRGCWWQGTNVSPLNLRKVYLQINVDKALWSYQTVMLKNWRYCLTQLGFSLNVAPLVMRPIIDPVMSQDKAIKNTMSTYINDICINKTWFLPHTWESIYQTMDLLARIRGNWKMEPRCWACRSRGKWYSLMEPERGSPKYSSKDYSPKCVLM